MSIPSAWPVKLSVTRVTFYSSNRRDTAEQTVIIEYRDYRRSENVERERVQ